MANIVFIFVCHAGSRDIGCCTINEKESPIFLEIRNPWAKVMEKVVSDMNIFVWKWSKITKQNKQDFFG